MRYYTRFLVLFAILSILITNFFNFTDVKGATLGYSTYLGGGLFDQIDDIAVDGVGNVYVTGSTFSADFNTLNATQPNLSGGSDAFVSKFSPNGVLIYSTYLGGDDREEGRGIAVDASGNAYVTGYTRSANFPTTVQAFQPSYGGGTDTYVTKLDPGGSLIYSTYLGGNGSSEEGTDIAVDLSGNVYVAGVASFSSSPTFPTLNAFQSVHGGGDDGFITKLDPTGSSIVYSTYIGGSHTDVAHSIAVDTLGNAYITGETRSLNFPTVNPLQPNKNGIGKNAFITKLDSNGLPVYSTYLGGSTPPIGGDNHDTGNGIAVDANGFVYVTGFTDSIDFPTVNAFKSDLGGPEDAFVTKLNPTGSSIVYSTYFGGSIGFSGIRNTDQGFGISADDNGRAYVTGLTNSTDLNVIGAIQSSYRGGNLDAFVAKFDPSGLPLFSSFFGGGNDDVGRSIGVDSAGNSHIAGLTNSPNFPVFNPIMPFLRSDFDGFVSKIRFGNTPAGTNIIFSEEPVTITFPQVDQEGDTNVSIYSTGAQPPTGFKLGNPPIYYNIQTTAVFFSTVEVCINYDENTIQGNENKLKLMHFEPGTGWSDITTSLDTVNNVICGGTTNFSDFAVITEPAIQDLIDWVHEMNLQQGIENSLDTKLSHAQDALAAQQNNNITIAVNSLDSFTNEVEAQRGNKLTGGQADELHSFTETLIKVIRGINQF
ncbi:MAG: SBBP repeat-containing protein [bacterium]|nr:SBBP repeat-containing protein [bacterium]